MKEGVKMKYRILANIVAVLSAAMQIAIPFAVSSAYTQRGYFAIGGEYGFIVFSIMLMFISLDILKKS